MNHTPPTRTTVTSLEQLQVTIADDRAGVVFAEGADGVQLTRDNRARPVQRHHCGDLSHPGLSGPRVVGQVQILARDVVCSGHVVAGMHVEHADANVLIRADLADLGWAMAGSRQARCQRAAMRRIT